MTRAANSNSLTAFHSEIKTLVDEALRKSLDTLPEHAPRLKQAMQYALLAGGKRVRPLLSLIIGEAIGVTRDDCMAISLAIECIHAYSLVHDDLPAMDDDSMRRGQPTCHIAFDEATAILAGDALQTLAFTLLTEQKMSAYADTQRATLVRLLARASGYNGMCGGQAIDLDSTGRTISAQTLTTLHRLKTGALLTACAEMVTSVAPNVADEHKASLIRFAQLTGLAFQIQDDILDVEGASAVIGKHAGSDEAQGKNTYPALLGLSQTKQELERLYYESLQAVEGLPYNTDYLIAFSEMMIKRDH